MMIYDISQIPKPYVYLRTHKTTQARKAFLLLNILRSQNYVLQGVFSKMSLCQYKTSCLWRFAECRHNKS